MSMSMSSERVDNSCFAAGVSPDPVGIVAGSAQPPLD
jgi:hypothetical protein